MRSAGLRAPAVRAGLFVLWIPIIGMGPWLASGLHRFMPAMLSSLLFFWPQLACPVNTFHGAPPDVGARVWPGWWVLYWVVVLIVFSLATRRLRAGPSFALAGLAAFGCTLLLQGAIRLSGLDFELDGP